MDSIIRGANWYVNEINQRLRTEMAQLPKLSRDLMPVVWAAVGSAWNCRAKSSRSRPSSTSTAFTKTSRPGSVASPETGRQSPITRACSMCSRLLRMER